MKFIINTSLTIKLEKYEFGVIVWIKSVDG